jgi:hypothetical protein
MVVGEDGMEFCYKNGIPENDEKIARAIEEAEESYPCGTVFCESEALSEADFFNHVENDRYSDE